MTISRHVLPRARPRRAAFTLVELIALLVVGAVLSAVVVTIAQQTMPHAGEETVVQVERQYDLLREVELLQSAYREAIEADELDLDALLADWTPANGDVDITVSEKTVSDASVTFTFSTRIRKVRFTDGDFTMDAYFAE